MVVLPKGWQDGGIAESDEDFSSTVALDVDVWGMVFARRRVDVNTKTSLIMDLDHGEG